jgi:ABC-type uncharacterized transport system auxiliary subunit
MIAIALLFIRMLCACFKPRQQLEMVYLKLGQTADALAELRTGRAIIAAPGAWLPSGQRMM